MRIKLFEEFSEWDRDDFLFDLFTMTSTEVEELFFEEVKSRTPHIEKIKVMLESGIVDVEAKNYDGDAPLHWAVYNNSIEIAELLIEAGADVKAKGNDGETPLHVATERNFIEIAKLLIGADVDVNAKDEDGWTPLHLASLNNHVEIAELLIEAGADVGAKSIDGLTPFDYAETDEMRALLGGGL